MEENIKLHLKTSEWLLNEGRKLITQYKSCKTAYAQNKLIQKMECVLQKSTFECKELLKLINYEVF